MIHQQAMLETSGSILRLAGIRDDQTRYRTHRHDIQVLPPSSAQTFTRSAGGPSHAPAGGCDAGTMSTHGHYAERTPWEASLEERFEHVVCERHSLTKQNSSRQ